MNAPRNRRGYTVVEIMISMAILMIGTSGIIAMQKVTAVANRDAKNLVVANQIARTWVERLRADAMKWNHPSPFQTTSDQNTDTTWLNTANITTNANGPWFQPATRTFDGFGNDVAAGSAEAVYCTQLRLTWLYGPPGTVAAPYLIRAEVRVFWLRDGGGGIDPPTAGFCTDAMFVTDIGSSLTRYHFVYVATALTENMARGGL
jgi:type II secretory pathway pseudopilin PulG